MLERWLRVFIALKEDLSSDPSTCVGQLTTACNCRVSEHLLLVSMDTCAQVYTHAHSLVHKIKIGRFYRREKLS